MLQCLTALEARAIAYLITPEDWSIFSHIEIRIKDSIQHGGTRVIYGGDFNVHVIDALRALGYTVIPMVFEDEIKSYKIKWEDIL